MSRGLNLFIAVLLLSGCSGNPLSFQDPPELSPVGSGLAMVEAVSVQRPAIDPVAVGADYSLWQDRGGTLFRNPRASHVGDVLTVKISVDDEASLNSSINRSREADNGLEVDASLPKTSFSLFGVNIPMPFDFTASGNSSVTSDTSTKGKGEIARREEIRLSVAAVVVRVLPNGNLLISGSQEVRVNHEVRVLTIAGVVRPQDIDGGNTISYDKIAEARVSYGGRGKVSDVQKPAWGQQLLDLVSPF